MRALFLLLVAVNLGFFAWTKFYAMPDGAADPEPPRRQVNPEGIRLLTGPELAGLPALKPRPASPGTQAILTDASSRGSAAGGNCAEWGGFSVAEAPRAEQVLEPLALGARLSQRRSEEAAKSRLEALRARGVRSAQTGERDTQVTKIWFQVRGADAALLGKLKGFAQALPGTEVRDCK